MTRAMVGMLVAGAVFAMLGCAEAPVASRVPVSPVTWEVDRSEPIDAGRPSGVSADRVRDADGLVRAVLARANRIENVAWLGGPYRMSDYERRVTQEGSGTAEFVYSYRQPCGVKGLAGTIKVSISELGEVSPPMKRFSLWSDRSGLSAAELTGALREASRYLGPGVRRGRAQGGARACVLDEVVAAGPGLLWVRQPAPRTGWHEDKDSGPRPLGMMNEGSKQLTLEHTAHGWVARDLCVVERPDLNMFERWRNLPRGAALKEGVVDAALAGVTLPPGLSREDAKTLCGCVLRLRWVDHRVLWIEREPDGEIRVVTGVVEGLLSGGGDTVYFRKCGGRWVLTGVGLWRS